MIQLATELRTEIDSTLAQLRKLTEPDVTRDRGAGKWVKKEILGHLIDSASNNHQWTELIDIWTAVNRQVAQAIESVPENRLIIEFAVLAIYGHVAGRAASMARKSRFIAATNRASGAMLVAAGTGLAWTNR